jgi:flagellar biogenesis protein FliO
MRDLFGLELPTAVTFAIAFVVVLLLIGVLAWAVRRFGATRLEAARSRQPRLAVGIPQQSTDAASSSSFAATTWNIF